MDFKLSPTYFSRYDHIIPFLIYISTLISFTLDLRKQRKKEMALKDATQCYKENKQLKRKTLLLVDKDTVDEGVDAGESACDADIDIFNKTLKQLSTEVAELQTELDFVRQNKLQILEQNTKLSEELEVVKSENRCLKIDLEELQKGHGQLLQVSELIKKELGEMREDNEGLRSDILELWKEAEEQKRERIILAHQRNLLLEELSKENGTDSLMLLVEIESLKRIIEVDTTKFEEKLNTLQERLENHENHSPLEERLKLVEAKLQEVIARAESKALPPPPPPPPLPSLFPIEQQPVVLLRRKKSIATVEDLCVQETTPHKKPLAPGVNENIINAIKEGKFSLRKKGNNNDSKEEDKKTAKAVSDILNTLGSLRRVSKKRKSQYIGGVSQLS